MGMFGVELLVLRIKVQNRKECLTLHLHFVFALCICFCILYLHFAFVFCICILHLYFAFVLCICILQLYFAFVFTFVFNTEFVNVGRLTDGHVEGGGASFEETRSELTRKRRDKVN